MIYLLSLVFFMAAEGLSQITKDWTQFNSSVLIEVTRPTGLFTCTGVALSPQLVLTAAHCLEGDVQNVKVFTEAIYNPRNPALEIQSYSIHPEYNPKISRFHHDLAKMTLKSPLPHNTRFTSIYKGHFLQGHIYRIGFGKRDQKNVRTVITPLFRKMDLKNQTLELEDIFSRSGDSGGPVFIQGLRGKLQLVAIHSTFSYGPEGEYSLNPRVASYLNWIFDTPYTH